MEPTIFDTDFDDCDSITVWEGGINVWSGKVSSLTDGQKSYWGRFDWYTLDEDGLDYIFVG